MTDAKTLEDRIYSSFSALAGSIGYSPVHGKIIASLLIEGRSLSLQELAKRTRYSISMISLSLDLLEVIGVIKTFRKSGDRKLYIRLGGDLLECLKRAILLKAKKGIEDSLEDLKQSRKEAGSLEPSEGRRILKAVGTLEKEMKRLETYMDLLSRARLP